MVFGTTFPSIPGGGTVHAGGVAVLMLFLLFELSHVAEEEQPGAEEDFGVDEEGLIGGSGIRLLSPNSGVTLLLG